MDPTSLFIDDQCHPESLSKSANQRRRIEETREAFTRNVLTLSVLVQNRRTDKKKVLVFASRAQLVSYGDTSDAFLKGRTEVDNLSTFTHEGSGLPCYVSTVHGQTHGCLQIALLSL